MIVFEKSIYTIFGFGYSLKLFVVVLKSLILVGFNLNADLQVILDNEL